MSCEVKRPGSPAGRQRNFAAVLFAIAAATLSLALARPAGAETIALRYGQTASTMRSVFSLPIFVAEREGFFAREGLEVTVVPIAGGTTRMIAALQAGTVDITHVSTPFLVRAVMDGSDAVAIAGEFANPIYSLVAKPGIDRFAALKGRTVGLAVAADTIAISTRKLMAQHGLKDGDVQVKELVGTPARFRCLREGACDAVPLGQPEDFVAADEGYRVLGRSSDAVPAFQYTVSAVRQSWAATHENAVVRYVRALAAAFAFIRDPARREAVALTIVATTGVSPAIARRILTLYFEPERHVLPKRGELDLAGLAQVIAFMGEAGTLTAPLPAADRFVDLRYLRRAGVEPGAR